MKKYLQLLPLSDIPNSEGFSFTGVGAGGKLYAKTVMKNEAGQFYVLQYTSLIGWLNNNTNTIFDAKRN